MDAVDNNNQNVERLAETKRNQPASNKFISTQPTPQNNPAGRLQYLCNKYGDFKVARAWRSSDGEMRWSKHRSVLECWETEQGIQFLKTVNNRQILPCEIVIDLDIEPSIEKVNWICELLETFGEHYKAYSTGSKGYHIHIWSNLFAMHSEYTRQQIRKKLLKAIGRGDDLQKVSEKIMIALEDVPHWKTGKLKTLIRQYPGEQYWQD